ncbi:MAG: ribosome-associated translation inhibitor RaiA [Phycisphaerales bacterium]|nr:ribosome-associated translation inhibitor RaiA [Phycisphaerales bacterium]
MQIKVKGKHIEVTEAIDAYAKKKAERLTRYFDRVLGIDIIIEKEPNGYHVEFIVDVEHHEDFIVNARDPDLYAAIDAAADKEARVIVDWKERVRNKKHCTD